MLKKIIITVFCFAMLGPLVGYFIRNTLVETAVEEGSSYALGVETDLGSASLEIGGGSVELTDLEISNPEGFEADNFMSMRRGMLAVDAGSILDDEVMVDSFVIEGVELNIEQIDSKGNYKAIMDHINQLDLSSSESESEQKFKVGLVAIRDVTVAGALTLMGNKTFEKSYTVDNITMKDIGSSDGVTTSELSAKVIKKIIERALASGEGILPGDFGKQLKDAASGELKKVEGEAKEKLEDAAKSLIGGGK